MTDLPPQYHPQDVEERLSQWWEAQGFFHADPDPTRRPYTIVIPPPNVTGILHMGHALNNAIQDILIRFKRMQGDNALWVPGTDHAGIATQNVVERALAKEGKRRQDLGREAFVQRVWAWKEEYGNTILYQLRRLGASCDWRRTRFTMDEGLSAAVSEVFIRLHQQGLIYRGHYIINWCPRCQTALSDEEAPRQPVQGKLYYIRYPLEGEGSRVKGERMKKTSPPSTLHPPPAFIEVATTRPETMLGDTAIAVHPKDPRYRKLIGRSAILPLVNRTLPIIADALVDRSFGTGAVKVTPAHDPADFQLGKKHDLVFISVMTDEARMTRVPPAYEGLDRYDCRSKLIVDLEQQGWLRKVEEHAHNVGHCYRCHTVIEPRLSPQWFVRMKPLARPAIRAVKDGTITFVPRRWTKVYLHWMEHLQDWCISRQIWWGHRLPVYYCDKCAQGSGLEAEGKDQQASSFEPRASSQRGVIVSKTRPACCPVCRNAELRQDEDVLDTWFSSWLWPFSTLGWPDKTKELAHFYPTSTLVTAQEIIFFWVARMIMAGYFCMKRPPFRTVYIHGTVRDITGKKMSKSLGNIIDPLQIIGQYGADALRYTLVTSTAIGQDIILSEERFLAGRNFANKLWNATRFVLNAVQGSGFTVQGDAPRASNLEPRTMSVPDRWILSRLQRTVARVTRSLERFLFSDAAAALYDFIWHDFCDWYLEIAKITLAQTTAVGVGSQQPAGGPRPSDLCRPTSDILMHVLETSLRLLHPFMPFVTEELWQHLATVMSDQWSGTSQATDPLATRHSPPVTSVMRAEWPKPRKRLIDEEGEALFARFQAVVAAIRNTRAELNVPLGSRPPVHLATRQAGLRAFFTVHRPLVQAIAQVGDITVEAASRRPRLAAATVVDGIEVVLPLAGVIDVGQERARLRQRVEELTSQLAQVEARLRDRQFARKAPKEVVGQTKARRAQTREALKKCSDHLALLESN